MTLPSTRGTACPAVDPASLLRESEPCSALRGHERPAPEPTESSSVPLVVGSDLYSKGAR